MLTRIEPMQPRRLVFDDGAVGLQPAQSFETDIGCLAEIVIALTRTGMGDTASACEQFVLPLESTAVAIATDSDGNAIALEHAIHQSPDPGSETLLESHLIDARDTRGAHGWQCGGIDEFASRQNPEIGELGRHHSDHLGPGGISGRHQSRRRSAHVPGSIAAGIDEHIVELELLNGGLGYAAVTAVDGSVQLLGLFRSKYCRARRQ